MTPGQIVLIDWRDAIGGTHEPNKLRPGVIVSSPRVFSREFPFKLAVPLTGEHDLAIAGASIKIVPTTENGCSKVCYALAWAVQAVPHARITETQSRISADQLGELRSQIAGCVDAA